MMRSLLMAALLAALATPASALTWRVGEGSEAAFLSQATLESFEGRTDQVRGHIALPADRLVGPLDLRIEVDLASLDTGIGMRNRHMRERHLETDEHPLAVFTGQEATFASSPELAVGRPVEVTVAGQFALHGVTRPLTVTATVSLAADATLTATASFAVKLSDHDIGRPRFLLLRLADEQQVTVRIVARPEEP
jgi:polyisoprenoid-binding protein YceI